MGKYGNIDGISTLTNNPIAIDNVRGTSTLTNNWTKKGSLQNMQQPLSMVPLKGNNKRIG